MNKSLKLFSFLVVCITVTAICSKIKFGYNSIFYLNYYYEDQNYLENIMFKDSKVPNLAKNSFKKILREDQQDSISWNNDCIKEWIESMIRCAGTIKFKYDFWSINTIQNQITSYVKKKQDNQNYEKFNFDLDKFIEFTFNDLKKFKNLFQSKKEFESIIQMQAISSNYDFLDKRIKNYLTNDLEKNFSKRHTSFDSWFRNPLGNIEFLLYLKILTMMFFLNILTYLVFYKLQKQI